MSEKIALLFSEAMKLSEVERAELADRILESIEAPPSGFDALNDHEFKAELDRRHDEYLRDPSVAVPWDEVKRLTSVD